MAQVCSYDCRGARGVKKYRTTYHIYDDFGDLIKISLDKPSDINYIYVKVKELVFDTEWFEEALI